jgi:hypothetical protein
MVEYGQERAAHLRQAFHAQTARIHWHELQTYYARGSVITVAEDLDLVEVAVQLGLDNASEFDHWIGQGKIVAVTDEQALAWFDANPALWAVVAPPWVLVQERDG